MDDHGRSFSQFRIIRYQPHEGAFFDKGFNGRDTFYFCGHKFRADQFGVGDEEAIRGQIDGVDGDGSVFQFL